MDSQLVSVLHATLSPDASTRQHAEKSLDSLMENSDLGLALARIALGEDVEMAVRQIAGVMLKKFMDKWWDTLGDALPQETKLSLLQALFQGLSLPHSKLRSQFAFSLSLTLLTPSATPSVLPDLLSLLSSGTQDQVHGAMRVFKEVIRKGDFDLADVTGGGGGKEGGSSTESDEKILAVVKNLSPVLLGVLGNEAHSRSTRASTIAVFRQCLETLFMLKELLPTLVNDTVSNVLPSWLEAFVVLLGQSDVGQELREQGRDGWNGLAIRRESFKTLISLHRSFPRSMTPPFLATLLPLAVSHLTSLLPIFTSHSISSTSDEAPPSLHADDPAEEEVTIEQVVSPVIDLLSELTRGGKMASGWIEGEPKKKKIGAGGDGGKESQLLIEVVGAVLGFTQMTVEDEETWANDPNAFVADEDDETDLYSIRIAGHDFISTLLEAYPKPTARVLQTSVHWRIGTSEVERSTGNPDWWKGLEASLAIVGSVSDELLDVLEQEETRGGPKSFDLPFLFDEVIPKFLAAQELPFLQGRAFVVASQYATALSSKLAGQYLDAAVQVVEASALGVSVKISAVKTIKNFCRHLDPATVKPLSHRILSNLVPLITQAGDEVLALLLESLRAVVGVDETALDPALMGQLVDVLLSVWAKNAKDPIICSIFEELFEHLASTPLTPSYSSLMSHSLPPLCSAITSIDPSVPESSTLAAAAIELVSSILRGRKGLVDPDGQGYIAGLGTVIFPGLLKSDDVEIIQNGVEALTLLIRKDCSGLLQSTDPTTSQTGLHSTFAVIARLLQPGESESRGLFLGDLIVHLLRNAGPAVAPVLPELIKAIVERLPTALYATFQQSLIIPLAYLIHTNFDGILPILESTPITLSSTPSSESKTVSALEVLLKSWTENAETFLGSWAIRVSTLALGQLFAASGERESLRSLRVRGEMIVDPATVGIIMTRSKTKTTPQAYTSIPFPLRALKLILAETKASNVSNAYNAAWDADGADEDDDDEDDDDDEGWEDDGPGLVRGGAGRPPAEFGFISDMMGPGGIDDDDLEDGDREDEDLQNDPVSNVDMAAHLTNLLRSAYQRMDSFGALAGELGEDERGILGSVLA